MSRFPYERYEKTPLWAVLSRVVDSLESNGDLEATTAKRYIIGYLAQQLDEAGLVHQVPPTASPPRKDVPARLGYVKGVPHRSIRRARQPGTH